MQAHIPKANPVPANKFLMHQSLTAVLLIVLSLKCSHLLTAHLEWKTQGNHKLKESRLMLKIKVFYDSLQGGISKPTLLLE